MKNFTERPASILPVFVLLLSALFSTTIAFAQEQEQEIKVVTKMVLSEDDHNEEVQIIEVTEINGETTIKVTTKTDGETITVEYTGEEAQKFLENEHNSWSESSISMEDMKFTFDVSEMEKGDCKKIIVMTSGDSKQVHEMQMEDFDIEITDDESGDQIKIEIKSTADDGKTMIKTMLIDSEQIEASLEDLEELLEELELNMDIEIDVEDTEKKIIIKKHIITEDIKMDEIDKSDHPSSFESITISPNSAEGEVQIKFTPRSKGTVMISVTDLQGNILFADKYNGKGAYSKKINLQQKGAIVIRLEQGNEVEVRKVIMK